MIMENVVWAIQIVAIAVLVWGITLARMRRRFLTKKLPEGQIRSTAAHEAGHVVVVLGLMPDIVQGVRIAHIQADTLFGELGRVLVDPVTCPQKEDYVLVIAMLYGGLVGEIVQLGRLSEGSAGSDLEQIEEIVINYLGMFGCHDGVTPAPNSHGPPTEPGGAEAKRIYAEGHSLAVSTIRGNMPLFEAIQDSLIRKSRLSREELLALLKQHPFPSA